MHAEAISEKNEAVEDAEVSFWHFWLWKVDVDSYSSVFSVPSAKIGKYILYGCLSTIGFSVELNLEVGVQAVKTSYTSYLQHVGRWMRLNVELIPNFFHQIIPNP